MIEPKNRHSKSDQRDETYKRMAWLYGHDYANAVWDGKDEATNADLAAWNGLGASRRPSLRVVRR